MRRSIHSYIAAFFSLLILSAQTLWAGETPKFKTLHVSDLVKIMKEGAAHPFLFDVNVESTRQHVGIIPGSRLLSGSSSFDASKELPKDQKSLLIFYCANTQCTASHTAAERAIQLGYKDVQVMVDGVYGWRSAGEPLEPVTSPTRSISPKDAYELTHLRSAVVVDVRENEERHEVVKNSLWIPMSQAQDSKSWGQFKSQLSKDKTVIFHCAAGVRSKKAAERLASEGYKTAYFKGPDEWKAAGLPLDKGPAN